MYWDDEPSKSSSSNGGRSAADFDKELLLPRARAAGALYLLKFCCELVLPVGKLVV